jgi:hypothetical protein
MATKPSMPSASPTSAEPEAEEARGVVRPIFGRGRPEVEDEEIRVGRPATRALQAVQTNVKVPPLAADTPLWFLIGAGKTGKSTFARWLGGYLAEQKRYVLMGAVDAGARSLARFFSGTEQPTVPDPEAPEDPERRVESRDPVVMAQWFRDLLEHELREPTAGFVDMGGNDTILTQQMDRTPDLVDKLVAMGVAPVATYFLSTRMDDLDPLASLEESGFQPANTVLVLNHGTVDVTLDAHAEFAPVRRHSAFRAAVERGVVVLTMPRLAPDIARKIERRTLHFTQARDGKVPAGRKVEAIGGLERSEVGRWMREMEAMVAPVREWLPR